MDERNRGASEPDLEMDKGCQCIGEMSSEWQARVDIIPVPAFLLDCHGVLRVCNSLFEDMIGGSRASLVGEGLPIQFDSILRDLLWAFCKEARRLSKPQKACGWLLEKSTQRTPITLRYHGVDLGVKGTHRGVLAIVSECPNVFENSNESYPQVVSRLHQLTRAIDQTADLVMTTDPAGNIEYVNWSFESTTGYSLSEVIGRNPRILQSGQHKKSEYTLMWSTITSGLPYKGIFCNRKKDGSTFYLEETITPIFDLAGSITNFIATGRDITEKRRLEQELTQAQKFEALGRLAGGIAHDFNNFLQVISGFTEMQLRGIQRQDPRHNYALRVLEASNKASNLVRQLLAFSRRQVLQPEKVLLSKIISAIYPMLQQLLPRNIQFELDVPPDSGCVLADPGQLEQVVMNLVLNARDAMPEGGVIRIKLSEEGDPCLNAEKHVVLVVSDNGNGIDQETRRHLFEPFFTTKEVGKGTGLGLATVLGIVKQSNGEVQCTSEKGIGTTFTVRFPQCDIPMRE